MNSLTDINQIKWHILAMGFVIVLSNSAFALNKKIFISFSMPSALLEQVAHQGAKLKIPLVLNGLYQNSMRKTLGKIFDLAQLEKNVSIQIDPVAFKKYGITRVPALVVDNGDKYDVIRGNVTITDLLSIIKEKGETNA